MKFLTNIFFTSLLSLLLLSNISYAQPNVQVLNYSHGKYVGEALNGKANGQGTYTSKSGVIYQGQFISDTFSGSGTMFWTNGDKFVGTWNNDSAVNGTMSFANGSSAQGTVRNAIFYATQSSSPPTNQNNITSQNSTTSQNINTSAILNWDLRNVLDCSFSVAVFRAYAQRNDPKDVPSFDATNLKLRKVLDIKKDNGQFTTATLNKMMDESEQKVSRLTFGEKGLIMVPCRKKLDEIFK